MKSDPTVTSVDPFSRPTKYVVSLDTRHNRVETMTKRFLFLLLVLTSTVAIGSDDLPLRKVVMFNSGLGYFEHEKQVTGTVEIELKFSNTDIEA